MRHSCGYISPRLLAAATRLKIGQLPEEPMTGPKPVLYQQIKDRLKMAFTLSGMTQMEVALRSGLDQSCVSLHLGETNGKRRHTIQWATLECLANAMGYDVEVNFRRKK